MKNQIIILAGGKGTRMKSDRPKVLTKIKDTAIVNHLLKNVVSVCEKPVIVVGYKGEEVIKETGNKYRYVWQKKQLGTGHALMRVKEEMKNGKAENIIVVPGDHPFLSAKTINHLIKSHIRRNAVISAAVIKVDSFEGLNSGFYDCGRIMRNQNQEIEGIIELKDADEKQRQIKEVNVSYYCFKADWLWGNIDKLKNNNKAKEYYLTDMVKIAVKQGEKVNSMVIRNSLEGLGVNTPEQLRTAKSSLRS